MRKLLDEQKQQAAAKDSALAAAQQPAAPVAVHIHVAAAASEEPAAAESSAASQQPPSSQAAASAVPHKGLKTLPSTSQASISIQTEPTELDVDPAALSTNTATQTSDARQTGSSGQNGQELNDLLTGSVDVSAGASDAVQQIPFTTHLLGLDSSLPGTTLAQTSGDAYQQSVDRQSADSLDVTQPAPSNATETALPELFDDLAADAQPSTSTPDDPSLSNNQTETVSATRHTSLDVPTNSPPAAPKADPSVDTDEHASPSQASDPQTAAAASHQPSQLEAAADDAQTESTSDANESMGGQTTKDIDPAVQYKQLLQEVSALRQRLHDCSVEALEGNSSKSGHPPCVPSIA